MLNKEKYKEKILEIACEGESIAINKRTSELARCGEFGCEYCLFGSSGGCKRNVTKWANSEAVEQPTLTDEEKAYLSTVIQPFRDEVLYILKKLVVGGDQIIFLNEKGVTRAVLYNFTCRMKFYNMKFSKKYTLEELGL